MGLYQVWYGKREYLKQYWNDLETLPDVKVITKTHVLANTVEAKTLEQVYRWMQGENWNPGNAFIINKGLSHTSMVMGDVVQCVKTGQWYLCKPSGWKLLSEAVK